MHELSRKINIVDCLSRHLAKGIPKDALKSYFLQVKKWCPCHPVIHIDDSYVVKPNGYKFESLGWMRDGSESTATKNVYKKGYHVTEATVLTNNNHPVSIFSEIHFSKEKDFTSINTIPFPAMDRAAALFGKATFVMDRGYDDNKIFLKLDSMEQDYVIQLTAKRKLLYHDKWTFATELRNRRKGKMHEAYLPHVVVRQIKRCLKSQIKCHFWERFSVQEVKLIEAKEALCFSPKNHHAKYMVACG